MSLGIAFKGAEGIVLAADSRVTLMALLQQQPGQQAAGQQAATAIAATFDNATKLLQVNGQKYVGAVTYGVGALGVQQPRTAHSFIPEFEAELAKKQGPGGARLPVKDFAQELSDFFLRQWKAQGMPMNPPPGNDMVFLVGGYDEDAPYGRVFEIFIPSNPTPVERHSSEFGMVWGGQREYIDRLITGFDPNLPDLTQATLKLTDQQRQALEAQFKGKLQAPIPFQFLPLQDCVNLAILLIRTTISIQTFLVGIRGVGGSIDLATVTRTGGLKPIQLKRITGEVGDFDYSDGEERL